MIERQLTRSSLLVVALGRHNHAGRQRLGVENGRWLVLKLFQVEIVVAGRWLLPLACYFIVWIRGRIDTGGGILIASGYCRSYATAVSQRHSLVFHANERPNNATSCYNHKQTKWDSKKLINFIKFFT
jgi:hypothetical protein